MTDPHPRLSLDPSDFSRFTRGSCQWFTGCGWRKGTIDAIYSNHVAIKVSGNPPRVIVWDARNVIQDN